MLMEKTTLTIHREFIRLKPRLRHSFMFIIQIKEQQVQTNHKSVLIDDLSPGGLKFTTDLKLPVSSNVVLGFQLNILNEWVSLEGYVVWRKGIGDLYEYGVKLKLEQTKRTKLIKLLNDLLLILCPENAKIHLLYRFISNNYLAKGRR